MSRPILKDKSSRRGLYSAAVGFAFLSSQDALVKSLAVNYGVPQILFVRSLIILLFALSYSRYVKKPIISANSKIAIVVLRSLCTFGAWMSFYTASRYLQLAEMTVLYFTAPIVVVILSAIFLGEKTNRDIWLSVVFGFVGVVVAAQPRARVDVLPVVLCLCASLCWASSSVLVRKSSSTETTINQIIWGSVTFLVMCGALVVPIWVKPTTADLFLFIVLGLVGMAGQFFLYEGFRYAPASLVAPVEYTMLIWAVLFGFAVWGDTPANQVLVGGCIIMLSGVLVFRYKQRLSEGSADRV